MSEITPEVLCRTAVIIPPKNHPILEKDIDPDALMILYRLNEAGFAGYLVGGGVRDLYIGKKPKDFDISTDARPSQLRKLFRNSRTIGRRFRLVQVFFRGNKIIEVSTLRSLSEYDDNAPEQILPANNTFGTVEEDAFRRDLTINSLFYEIKDKTVIDYVGGVQDIADRIVRIVGDPDRRLTRDPVRILRAVRHAARADFTIEEKTREAIIRHVEKLHLCPSSRIRDELFKDLQSGASSSWAKLAIELGIFTTIFPSYQELFQGPQGEEVQAELFALLRVLDSLYNLGKSKALLDDSLLFALILLPWAKRRFSLMEQESKGTHHLMKAIREELDLIFSQSLNMKRMLLDNISTLYVHLPVFQEHTRTNKWPGWLRKKSYFSICCRFAALCLEAQEGKAIDTALFPEIETALLPEIAEPLPAPAPVFEDRGEKGKRNGGGSGPAFSRAVEGVFGLRKELKNIRLFF
jgi:poly(A) polymerase